VKSALHLLLTCCLFLFISSCADLIDGPFHGRDRDSSHSDSTEDHDNGSDTTDHGGSGDTTTVDSTVCFSRDILPVLVSNCAMAKCHDEASHEDGVVLTTYEYVMRNVVAGSVGRSELYEVITETDPEKIMPPPPGGLRAAQIALIARWIREGATNRDCANETPCNTKDVTYTSTIAPILSSWCVGCHAGSGASAGIDLTNRSVVEAQARSGALIGTVTHTTGFAKMPPSGPKLDDCSIAQVKAWVAGGLK
jgi:mono/diheme cytochrome c family protein